MTRKISVNLPVRNLEQSMNFFGALGYGFNPKFTNQDAACMVVSDEIFVMLLTEPYFKTFTKKDIVDAHTATEVLVCLNAESREAVDAYLETVLGAGATEARGLLDHGFMYGRSFNDPDGHIWEIMWMDEAAANS